MRDLFLAGFIVVLIFSKSSLPQSPVVIGPEKSRLITAIDKKIGAGDIPKALAMLEEAISQGKELFDVLSLRAYVRRFHLKDYDGAIADLTKAIEIRPYEYQSYVARSELKAKRKNDFAGALHDIDQAENAGLSAASAASYRGALKKEQKDYRGAVAEYEKALSARPDSISSAIELTWLIIGLHGLPAAAKRMEAFLIGYKEVKGGKLPRVVGEKVIKNSPALTHKNPSGAKESVPVKRHTTMDLVANSKAELDARLNENEEGKKLAEAYSLLGSVYLQAGELAKAFHNLTNAVTTHRNQDDAYGLRALVYLERGEYALAINDLDRAIDIVDLPFYYFYRGVSRILSGEEKRGRKDIEKYLELYPEGKTDVESKIAEFKRKHGKS